MPHEEAARIPFTNLARCGARRAAEPFRVRPMQRLTAATRQFREITLPPSLTSTLTGGPFKLRGCWQAVARMQGLRPFLQQQDENSVASLHRGLNGKTAFGGDAGLMGQVGRLPGQRRVLGTLTNRGGGLDAENAPPSKTPAAAGPRRALGDITNNAHAKQQQRTTVAEKPGLAAQAALTAVAKPVSMAELLADDGVERLAGKGWQQLEAERQAREDAEIDQRLLAFASLGKRSLPTFFPLWGTKLHAVTQPDGGLEHDTLPSLPPSPCMSQQPSGRSLDANLEDFELPEISFALPSDDDILG